MSVPVILQVMVPGTLLDRLVTSYWYSRFIFYTWPYILYADNEGTRKGIMVIAVVGSMTKYRNVMMNYYWIACLTLLATAVSAFTVPSSSVRLPTTQISESFGLDFAEDSYENTPDKLLSTRPHSRKAMGNMLKLFCALVDEKGNPFSIKIDASESVDDLKDAIAMKRKYQFAADMLQLFLAKKSDGTWLDSSSDDVKKLKEGEKNSLIETLTRKDKELQGEFGLDEVLYGMPIPKTKEIHVLVVVPKNAMSLLDDGTRKQQRIQKDVNLGFQIGALTNKLRSFANAQLVDGCIQSQDQVFLPYPQDNIQKLYVRQCYEDVFHLLIQCINLNKTSFAISGTPGIGKSLFFVYILYRLMDDFKTKTLPLKPNRVVYQVGPTFECFDLQQQVVTRITTYDVEGLVQEEDTFYVIDGQTSVPLISSCVVLFISSPRSEEYKAFVKQKKAKKWYFPVWTLAELQTCQRHCYPDLPTEMLQERHRIYGGVARFVFHDDYSILIPKEMQSALNDVDAICGVKYVGETTSIFPSSHTLLQIMVGDDEYGNAYQFTRNVWW
jgi:Crinkler effector protein N-terminal domain